MKEFYLYKSNNELKYQADQIFETSTNIFLIESNNKIKLEQIQKDYTIDKNSFYVLIVINKNDKSFVVKYGDFGYCHSLYYFLEGNSIYIDIHLKNIINLLKQPIKLNKKAANEFVKYGFLINNNSLVENVFKLLANEILEYKDYLKITKRNKLINFKVKSTFFDEALEQNLPDQSTPILIPLSGGFDSTFLAYLTKKFNDKYAITVGALRDPKNEFSTASKTASYFHIKHFLITDIKYWITNFPKMIYLMEGEMFDGGLFLCYALVEEIKKHNLTNVTVVSGDGSDQLLNKNFYVSNLNEKEMSSRHEAYFFEKNPLQCFYYLITKKLEWLLRENNIKYCIPFISENFYNCAKDSKDTSKSEYKKNVKTLLPEEISQFLDKKGGIIKENFFVSTEMRKKFEIILMQPKWFDFFELKDLNTTEILLYKMYIVFFNYIFIEAHKDNFNFGMIMKKLLE